MINKTIHYCWFGGNPLPPLAKKCIESWKKYCPDYEIKEWNEKNFDINCNQYVKEAYEAKKYAFVSDYVRLYALYTEGGVYMDTDVEVIKPIDEFLKHQAFSGFETYNTVPTGIMGAEIQHPFFNLLLEYYRGKSFIKKDGSYDMTTNVETITNYCLENGLKTNNTLQNVNGFTLYPKEYFCPKDHSTGKINIHEDTYTIHHFAGSWMTKKSKVKNCIIRVLGPSMTPKIVRCKKKIYSIFKGVWG